MFSNLEEKWTHLNTVGKQTTGVTKEYNPLENVPEWFDLERFTKAQILSKKYFLSLNISHFIGNILLVLLPDIHIPIVASGQNSTVSAVLKRVLSTIIHINSWYDDNPFDKNSSTFKSLRQVRLTCHLQMTKLMNEKYPKDKKYKHIDENDLWLSQFDMTMTQWSLIGLIAIRPNNCAFYLDEPLDDNDYSKTKNIEDDKYYVLGEMIYFWRVIGYCMGIKDEFNCCSETDTKKNIEYLKICFDRGYRPHLANPNPLVKNGLNLVEGLFLGLNYIVPEFIISNGGFMKYWYECLDLDKHDFELKTISAKISYFLHKLQFDKLMKSNIIYKLNSLVFFYFLKRILSSFESVNSKIQSNYAHISYNVLDDNGNPYSVINTAYKSNVKN